MKFNGKVAVVTGGARGIGRAIALRLARDGAGVAVADINMPGAELVASEIQSLGGSAIAVQADVASENQVEEMIGKTVRQLGRVDIAVANAGILIFAPLVKMRVSDWQHQIDTNLTGMWLTCKHAAGQMIAQGDGGKIILASSQGGKVATSRPSGGYVTTKHAVIGLTRALALELAKHKINVNAYCPGPVDTPMLDMIHREASTIVGMEIEEFKALMVRDVPMGRVEQPEDVAKLVAFLASPESDFITGQAINVGSSTMH